MSRFHFALAALLLFVLGGCATAPGSPNDPFEGFNRSVFSFNETVDNAVLKPVATGYQKVVPQFVRTSVDNFFANLGDAWSAVNLVLQAKPVPAIEMGMRFVFNSTLGLGGLFDIAGDAGMERRNEDFGQTLGRWGVGPGPYLVLPILGPSTTGSSSCAVVSAAHRPRSRRFAAAASSCSTRRGGCRATRASERSRSRCAQATVGASVRSSHPAQRAVERCGDDRRGSMDADLVIPTADGPMPTHLAEPGGTPRGAVVVVQEAYGLTPHIRTICSRLAAAGWLVWSANCRAL